MYMSFAIACGVEICVERQPYKSNTRENKRIKSKLTYHCSFIRQWILAWCVFHLYRHPSVCSFCNVVHHGSPSAFQQIYIFINIHYPHTMFLLYINYIFFKIYFFYLLDYSYNKHFFI